MFARENTRPLSISNEFDSAMMLKRNSRRVGHLVEDLPGR